MPEMEGGGLATVTRGGGEASAVESLPETKEKAGEVGDDFRRSLGSSW